LIGNEFDQGQNGEDTDRPDSAHESQRRAGKIDPSKVGRPSHNRRRRQGPQARHYTNTKRQQQHESRTHEVSSITTVDSIAGADREIGAMDDGSAGEIQI
jgi:hypothetical protein